MKRLIDSQLKKAPHSARALSLLNLVFYKAVPFNRPHGIRIVELSDCSIKTKLPYIKKNYNHLNGLHACALASTAEFSTGVLLIKLLGMSQYRLIMKSMHMDYFYQGKSTAFAEFSLPKNWAQEQVLTPLKDQDAITVEVSTELHDMENNHLCTGLIEWQVKPWGEVNTK